MVRVGESDLGRFVVGDRALGIGRLSGLDGNTARIRYFRGPTKQPYVDRTVDRAQVAVANLHPHMRVYLHDGRRWRIGRIDAKHPDDGERFVLAFPNRHGAIMSADGFDIRWTPRIEDPYQLLLSLGTDSPAVYEPRVDLIAVWNQQRASASGVDGLLLGSIELHDHQITVVRSVSSDSERRYLLADEVGLGKTIEAGALIWQSLRDRPTARVLILAPDHLRHQWDEELRFRFHLSGYPDASIRICAHEEWRTWSDGPVDLLVVDEAHHLTRAGSVSDEVLQRVAGLAHGASEVFLLSATPVRSNEVAFLDLLHLLDPKNYQPQNIDAFTRRVKMRDQVALLHQALSPDLDEFEFSLYAEELRSTFPDDEALAPLIEQTLDCNDEQRSDRILRVRDHLSATYRLHHRLLRTRRTPEISASFGVRGRRRGRPFTVEVPDESDALRIDLLEDFRQSLSERVETDSSATGQAIEAFRLLGQACGSLPHAILELATEEPGHTANHEARVLVRHWLESLTSGWRRDLETAGEVTLEAVANQLWAMAISKKLGKVVVATSFSTVADVVSTTMASSYGARRVARHVSTQSREVNASEVKRWQTDDGCSLLICDSSAEEGMNLQNANAVIHLDLPWEVFRLEQRIGRADRFVRGDSQPVDSMVFVYGEQPYALGWFLFAADACGVFDRSVSSLQYVIADTEADVLSRVIAGGAATLEVDIESLRETLDREAERIAAHDSLDSTGSAHGDLNYRLLVADEDSRLPSALSMWLTGVGAKISTGNPGTIQVSNPPRPQVPFSLEIAMAPWVGHELALSRQASVDRGIPLVRAGHGLLDEIVRHLVSDDRGVSFAFLRPVRGHWPPTPVFRTDFLVSTSTTQCVGQVVHDQGLGSWFGIARESLVAPALETVYTSGTGMEIENGTALRPYDRATGDRNLGSRPELFEALTSHLDWDAVCSEGLVNARLALNGRASVEERRSRSAELLRSMVEDYLAVLRARGLIGMEPVEEEIQAFEAVATVLPDHLELDVEVLGCGVIVFADSDRIGA